MNESGPPMYEDLNKELVRELPELREEYEKVLEYWGDEKPGPHIVYGDILVPRIRIALEVKDEDFLRRSASLIEKMSAAQDKRIQEVVAMTIIEGLVGEGDLLTRLRSYLLPRTKILLDEMVAYWAARRKQN